MTTGVGKSRVLAVALCAATVALIYLGYQATRDADHSTRLLLDQRVAEELAVLWGALARDMRGAHATVLTPVTPGQLVQEPPYDLAEAFARGFARFPYPEFFFTWNGIGSEQPVTYLFTRADRPPAWHRPDVVGGPYPVTVGRNPEELRDVVERARQAAELQGRVGLLETTIGGVQYQVIVNYLYGGTDPTQLAGLVGFAANLGWIRERYFDELVFQVARIGGAPDEMSLQVIDGAGQIVTSTRPPHADIPPAERAFPLVFVDRVLLGTLSPMRQVGLETWMVRVGVARDSPLAARADRVAGTFTPMALAAIAALAGLIVTVRGARVAAQLAAMKSDFVSSVTHELKTPLAVIGLIADTLSQGRYTSEQTVRDYAALLGRESRNLSRLVDNLLAYARLSDVSHAYTFEPLDAGDLVDDALGHFSTLLAEQQFTVDVDVPPDLPPVYADRSAALQALDNIIDNAIKYSNDTRVLKIRGDDVDRQVALVFEDRGSGIREDEVARVSDKFFRGRDAKRGGSGLGLAIVRQIVEAHGGRLEIASKLGNGTRVEVRFPQAAT